MILITEERGSPVIVSNVQSPEEGERKEGGEAGGKRHKRGINNNNNNINTFLKPVPLIRVEQFSVIVTLLTQKIDRFPNS